MVDLVFKMLELKWGLTCAAIQQHQAPEGRYFTVWFTFLQPGVLVIEPGPPKWFSNALSARPWRRSTEIRIKIQGLTAKGAYLQMFYCLGSPASRLVNILCLTLQLCL